MILSKHSATGDYCHHHHHRKFIKEVQRTWDADPENLSFGPITPVEFCCVILLGPQVLSLAELASGQAGAWEWGGGREGKGKGGC